MGTPLRKDRSGGLTGKELRRRNPVRRLIMAWRRRAATRRALRSQQLLDAAHKRDPNFR
jgi:hypothetical protein